MLYVEVRDIKAKNDIANMALAVGPDFALLLAYRQLKDLPTDLSCSYIILR